MQRWTQKWKGKKKKKIDICSRINKTDWKLHMDKWKAGQGEKERKVSEGIIPILQKKKVVD